MKTCVLASIKSLTLAGLLSIFALGSVNVLADVSAGNYSFKSLNGITPPSLPAFVETVKVAYNNSGSGRVLTATFDGSVGGGVSLLVDPSKTFTIKNTSYALNAVFNNSNQFQSGTVAIKGTISGLGINTAQTLMTANLTKFATGFGNYVLGFNTSNIVCNPNVNAYVHCTTNEAVYIGLSKSFNFKTGYAANGVALTSVPVPAAVWLFGSGLVGLVGIARRKQKMVA